MQRFCENFNNYILPFAAMAACSVKNAGGDILKNNARVLLEILACAAEENSSDFQAGEKYYNIHNDMHLINFCSGTIA
jgi:hypothetical protein